MMRSIAPFWDGNETWLVLGGVGLLVAFPLAYAIIMPAFYLPVIVMLLALVFRGVAFEFRERRRAARRCWNAAFAGGSTLAGFAQGVILGGLIQGITVENGAFAGGTFDWATPFALLCGLALVVRLRAARRDLADDEDRGRGRRSRARRRRRCCCSPCWASWRRSACGRRSRSRASPSAGSRCRTSTICGRCRW